MKVDSVITLENNLNCLLLDKAVYKNNNYFLAILLDEDNEPTDDSVVLKEIIEDGKIYIEREGNEEVLAELLKMFVKSFAEDVESLPPIDEEEV